MTSKRAAHILLLICTLTTACAPYAANTPTIRSSLSAGDYAGAFAAVERAAQGPSKLLFFLEGGLIAHYDGDYAHSNALLEQAERIADELFTRSLSRELAALVTSDESRHYRGETYELVFIHYYCALNYWYLDLPEDALVECRKANLKLEKYTSRSESEVTYKNDPFIHYLAALFYESEGEYNDAYISLKDAASAYRLYTEKLGLSAPAELREDLARVESELGYAGAVTGIQQLSQTAETGELIVFAEFGFIPRKTQEEVSLPIYDSDLKRVRSGRVNTVSTQIRHRRERSDGHAGSNRRDRYGRYRSSQNVDYWLRVALPRFESAGGNPKRVRIVSGDLTVTPAIAQNLDGLARLTLDDHSGSIFGRTVARALIKLAATKGAEKKSEWLGFLVNLFTAATEKADTRSWVTLPREIRIGRLSLPPGQHTITIQILDESGDVLHETLREVHVYSGKRTFINHRHYG